MVAHHLPTPVVPATGLQASSAMAVEAEAWLQLVGCQDQVMVVQVEVPHPQVHLPCPWVVSRMN